MEASTVRKSNHGANVRRWREWRGINQDVLAEQIGVAQTTMSSYEKREKLEPEIVEKIAKALDIPVEAITEISDDAAINIISSTLNAHDNAAIFNLYPTFNPIDKLIEVYSEKNELYERMLKEKDSVIELLQEVVKERK